MRIVIDVTEKEYENIRLMNCIAQGRILPKGHGKLVDISQIDKDKLESSNPLISVMVNGEYIEAVSLDYLSSLPTIIEADRTESEEV